MSNARRFLLAACLLLAGTASAADYLVYAGTYTKGASKGIYGYRFSTSTGKLRPLGLMAESVNPSFLVDDAKHQYLYAVNEDDAGPKKGDTVSAYSRDAKTGKLKLLNSVSAKGLSPCHLSLDKTGRWLAVSDYNSGSMVILPVQTDGRLGEAVVVEKHEGKGPNAERQEASHAHEAVFSPDNRFLFLADLGLDKIFIYRFDAAKGAITPAEQPFAGVSPGAGVRHLTFHPNGRVVYAMDELSSAVTAFRYDAGKGTLTEFQTLSALPASFKGVNTAAEIEVNSAGTMLYGSNRGHDSIALFSIDPNTFNLRFIEATPTLGKTPRHFALDPTGSFLLAANQDSDSIVVFRVHPNSGQLSPLGRPVKNSPMPVCLLFVP